MEKTCNKCGKTLPLEMFPKGKNTCKICKNKYQIEWRKQHGRTESAKEKDNLRCALKREERKQKTGKTYRNAKEAEDRRAYARKYETEHKDDPKHREMKRRCSRNAQERKSMKRQVVELDEFFSGDFEL